MEQEGSQLEKLLTQCKSNADVDVKVDALNKLQALFEAGTEIDDPDGLINVLKTCLRTSNLHLLSAAVAAIPPALPILFSRNVTYAHTPPGRPRSAMSSNSSVASGVLDMTLLRHTLNAFLPPGGLIERLGDKERVQQKAREALVLLGGYAFRAGGTSTLSTRRDGRGVETPLMIFERFLREAGLTSKVWKVREQSILTLVHIRRSHHQFPLRPFLPILVGALEDTDAHVRDCARVSVVELFTGPAVTDAARADLKKELAKKGVRKTIADSVLAQVLSGVSAPQVQIPDSSDGGETSKPKEYIPPSIALQSRKPSSTNSSGPLPRTASSSTIPRPPSRAAVASPPLQAPPSNENAEVRPVYIASSRDLENEFAQAAPAFEGKESEHNWAAREGTIVRVRGMLKGEVHLKYPDTFFACLKDDFIKLSLKTLASLRTTVAVHTCQLYSELAVALGSALDPFAEVLLTNLLGMSGFTKKITAQESQATVTTIITHTTPPPRAIIPLLWHTMQEKSVQSRTYAVAHIKHYVEVHGQRARAAIESHGFVDILEKAVKKSVSDANPSCREKARIAFWSFESVWPDRGAVILDALDNQARKAVEKACPDPSRLATLSVAAPAQPKKSSVAAAIAASRAKARAIANAPPTLRHQATSGSHTTPARRAGSPSTSPKLSQSVNRPASPLSPPSARSRIVSNGVVRPPLATSTSHGRTTSSGRASPTSPPMNRRTSSPLASPTQPSSGFRRAVNTALPASPPAARRDMSLSPPRRMPNGTARGAAVPLPRPSINELFASDDQSLLLASGIPVPDDSDSEGSINLMTFSSPIPMEKRAKPRGPKSTSQEHSLSPESSTSMLSTPIRNTLSSDSIADMVNKPAVVEDVLSANAEQAMSAAERLLELNDSEDGMDVFPIPSSLLVGKANGNGAATPKPMKVPKQQKLSPAPLSSQPPRAPVTPMNRNTMILRQASLFKDSPVNGARSASLMDVLQDRRQETGWWLKRKALMSQGTPLKSSDSEVASELNAYITQLEGDDWDVRTLQKLALICKERPAAPSASPPLSPRIDEPANPFAPPESDNSELWKQGRAFDRLFEALLKALNPERSEEELEYGLILLWEILENQWSLLEGREGDAFSALFQARYSNKVNVLEATNSLRDALCARMGPVYGITTLHASLKVFHAEKPSPTADEVVKAQSYAFGLMALGKLILRVPAEIVEEELPRLKSTLIEGLNDKSSLVVRESAAAVIIAAQMVMRDETHLFALLDGLADEKKNLLTYLFDKHGARGTTAGMDKLEKEMRRLDTRTSTPPRRT
ncbi:clasp N terminal-domain-containing protein [Schizophyllum commune]